MPTAFWAYQVGFDKNFTNHNIINLNFENIKQSSSGELATKKEGVFSRWLSHQPMIASYFLYRVKNHHFFDSILLSIIFLDFAHHNQPLKN